MNTIIIRTSWDRRTKHGGWSASSGTKMISGGFANATSDRLVLTAMIESAKRFGQDGEVKFVTSNGRVKHAVRHPATTANEDLVRELKACTKVRF